MAEGRALLLLIFLFPSFHWFFSPLLRKMERRSRHESPEHERERLVYRKVKRKTTVDAYFKEFGPHLQQRKDGVLFCSLCHRSLDGDRDSIRRHFSGKRHKNRVKDVEGVPTVDSLLCKKGECVLSVKKCLEVFTGSGVGIYQACKIMQDPIFKAYGESALRVWPSGTWLSEKYIKEIESEKIEETRKMCCSSSIGLSIDETPDRWGRKVIAIVLSTWKESHVSLVKVFPQSTSINGERIRNICLDHIMQLSISPLNVRYFTSDNASYMDTGFTALKTSFQNIERVRCLSHGINLVIKCFCEELKPLATLMKLIRKFLKAGLPTKRVTRMRRCVGSTAPAKMIYVKSRWNSWLESVQFLHANHGKFCDFFSAEALGKKGNSVSICELLSDNKAFAAVSIASGVMPTWMDLLSSSEGFDTFGTECMQSFDMARREMERLTGDCSDTYAQSICQEMPADMESSVSSMIKAAAKKALEKCRKYVEPTLKHATRRILLTPREASKMDVTPIFPCHDFGMNDVVGRVPQAWDFYCQKLNTPKWENVSSSSFWDDVLTNDALANIRPLFHSVAEKVLCCSLTEASVERAFSHLRDLLSSSKKVRLSEEHEAIELLVMCRKRQLSPFQ